MCMFGAESAAGGRVPNETVAPVKPVAVDSRETNVSESSGSTLESTPARILSPETEQRVPVVQAILATVERYPVPLATEILDKLRTPDRLDDIRYGAGYLRALGTLIRRAARHYGRWGLTSQSDGKLERLESYLQKCFGLQVEDLVGNRMFYEYYYHCEKWNQEQLEQNFTSLVNQANASLASYREQLAELATLATWQTEKIFWQTLLDAMKLTRPECPVDIPQFAYYDKTNRRFSYCKDAEFYHVVTLPNDCLPNNYPSRRELGARCTVWVDAEGQPLLYQKTGTHKMESDGGNATAINLRTIAVGGIQYPPGVLWGVQVRDLNPDYYNNSEDQVHNIAKIEGLVPLRPTMFMAPPREYLEAFGAHYQDFEANLRLGKHYPVAQISLQTFQLSALRVAEKTAQQQSLRVLNDLPN